MTTISEENIAEMVSAAQNIATDSTAMRQKMIDIEKKLRPIFQTAGIEFHHPTHSWAHYENVGLFVDRDGYECRSLIIEKRDGRWALAIHTENEDEGIDKNISFAEARRDDLIESVKRMPDFLVAYYEEIGYCSARFADLRKKAEAMKAIVEG